MSIFKEIASNPALQRQMKESSKKDLTTNVRENAFKGPDGDYIGFLVAERTMTKNGNLMAFFEYEITEGEHAGTRVSNCYWFGGDRKDITIEQMLRALLVFGVDIEADEKEKQASLDRFIAGKTLLRFGVRSSGKEGYFNVFPNAIITEDTKEQETSTTTEEAITLVSKVVLFQDEECLVSAHDKDTGKVTLVNPEDEDDLWYKDVEVEQLEFV